MFDVLDSVSNFLTGKQFLVEHPLNTMSFLGFIAGALAVSMGAVLTVRLSSRSGLCQKWVRMRRAVQNFDILQMQESREPRYSRLDHTDEPLQEICETEQGMLEDVPVA